LLASDFVLEVLCLLFEFVQLLGDVLILEDVVVVVEHLQESLLVDVQLRFDLLLFRYEVLLEFELVGPFVGEDSVFDELVQLVDGGGEVNEGHVGAHVGQEPAETVFGREQHLKVFVEDLLEPCELDLLCLHFIAHVDFLLQQRLYHGVEFLGIFNDDFLAVLDCISQFAVQIFVRGFDSSDRHFFLLFFSWFSF